MEVKFRIIEIYPKPQTIKNNQKDIISISFISNDYTKKIGNIEQSIAKSEKIEINLKAQNNQKEIIKCILLRNNNIICSGEMNLEEGTNWYKLDEIKNNKMSKESLITSSTSNGNFQNINNNINLNLIRGGSSNLSDNENSNSLKKNGSLTKTEIIKIKLMVYYIKTKNTDNNTISEQNESSVRIRDSSFEKGKNNFDNSLCDIDTSKLNSKAKLMTTDKKNTIKKTLLFGNHTKKISKNKIIFNISNKSGLAPIASGDNIVENNDKEISNTLHNISFKRPSKKKFIKDANNHKPINENMKMKTSFNFYKRKNNPENNNYMIDNKLTKKKSSNKINHHKLNSCENFEDTILDQKFKNDLKNDENLRANLFSNNSFNSIDKKSQEKNNDLFEIKDNYNYSENINNYDEENNYAKDNYERLKVDFHLLYSEENIKNINNEDSFLEMQLMGEKLLKLQHFHQIEYNKIFNDIIKSKRNILNNQNLYIQITKKMNKLHVKRLKNSLKNDEAFIEPISNFINVRRKIIKNSEFSIWEKLMMDSNKTNIKNNIKNKMINIFLNICSKNENKLNKLSLKFFNEMKEKEKQNKSSDKKSSNKKKYNYKGFDENKGISIDTKMNPHNFNNISINKTSKNSQYNTNFMPSSKSKISSITKKIINIKNNYSNIINETTNHSHNYNTNKINHKSKQLNGGNKLFNSKKVVNKNQ